MTNLEINIAIAEMCGWGFLSKDKFIVIPPNSPYSVQPLSTIPDYVNDLNAMHDAEKVLTSEQINEYADWLLVICNSASSKNQHWFNATASQRAEAFLRTIGKWKEDKP